MISEGFELMIIGMSVVFVFLSILVCAMLVSAKFFTTFAHLFPEEQKPVVAMPVSGDDHTEIAAAIAAVKAYIG